MNKLHSIIKRVRNSSAKQMIVAGVFTLALSGAVGLGLQQRQSAMASAKQDCSAMAVLRCGASGPSDYINKLKANKQNDLQSIAANFNKDFKLPKSQYDRFAKEARMGTAYKDGRVVVDGQTVLTDSWLIGRLEKKYSSFPKNGAYEVNGKTYYRSQPKDGWGSTNSHPVMVLFNKNGEVEYAALATCGNPVGGKKVKVNAECKALNMKAVSGKQNTYEFTTNVSVSSLAKVEKVEYYLDGKKFATETDPKKAVTKTFAESGKVTVKVYVKVPGKQTKVISSDNCAKQVTVKKPYYECSNMVATVRSTDEDHTTYRFTVTTKQGNGAALKDADFIVNGKATATNVTKKDSNGNIYHEIKLEGGKTYVVEAKVKFTVNGETKTATQPCKTTVKPEKEEKPFYACDALSATTTDEAKRAFRFTVMASYGNGAELTNADFAIWKTSNTDDKTIVTGVTQKDADGNIYHEAEFPADGEERFIEATVHFNVKGNVQSVKCQTNITPEEEPEQPVCPVPGKGHLPPNHPDCESCPIPGKEDLPKDSDECVEDEQPVVEEPAKELPKTGAGSVIGIFASVTGAGAAIHRIVSRRFTS